MALNIFKAYNIGKKFVYSQPEFTRSKLPIQTLEQISHLVLKFPLLTLNM